VNDFESISKYGYLGLDVRNGAIGEGIFIPQHGLGQPKQIALESDMNLGGLCRIDDVDHYGYAPGSDIGYFCDTTTSSSGSPVISSVTGKVIALHHLGGCFNSGTKISKIWPQVASHFDGVVPKADSAWNYEPVNQAPQAEFDISCESLSCELDASPSADADGRITVFNWSLGDGSKASGKRVIHDFARAAEYTIVLEVVDDAGAVDVIERTVSVSAPNIEPTARFSSTCIETLCRFDASGSSDEDGSLVSWNWSLGDGTSAQGERVEYAYQDEGTFSVRLTVKDDVGANGSRSTTIVLKKANRAPDANFSVVCEEQTCDFDAGSSVDTDGSIAWYLWSFDDGRKDNGVSVKHVFASEGSHSATLTIRDNDGAEDSRTRSFNVVLPDEDPVANFSYSCSGTTCQLEASTSSNDGNFHFNWDFGDGNTGDGSNTVHEYARSGYYAVTLLIADSGSTSAAKTRTIKIKPPELSLSGYGNRQSTRSMATVIWSGAESETVEIYRNGIFVASTPNDGKFVDLEIAANAKTAQYTICEAGAGRCSDNLVLQLQIASSQMQTPAGSAGVSWLRSVQKKLVNFR
jgi:PKD repeat protein